MCTSQHYTNFPLALSPRCLGLLGSLKALMESYMNVHRETMPTDLDVALLVKFTASLCASEHYVVRTSVCRVDV